MVDDRQARETLEREWKGMVEGGRNELEEHEFFKRIAWTVLSGYFRYECKYLTKARRDRIVVRFVEELGRTPLGRLEDYKKLVRDILDRAIREA